MQLPFPPPRDGLPISGFPLYDLTRGRRRSRFILVFGAAYDSIIDILLPSSHPQYGSDDLDTKARLSLSLPGIQAAARRSGSLLPCSRKPMTDRGPWHSIRLAIPCLETTTLKLLANFPARDPTCACQTGRRDDTSHDCSITVPFLKRHH